MSHLRRSSLHSHPVARHDFYASNPADIRLADFLVYQPDTPQPVELPGVIPSAAQSATATGRANVRVRIASSGASSHIAESEVATEPAPLLTLSCFDAPTRSEFKSEWRRIGLVLLATGATAAAATLLALSGAPFASQA